MRCHALQMEIRWEAVPENLDRLEDHLVKLAPQADDLVVLPELFATGFGFRGEIHRAWQQVINQRLSELARRWACHLIAGVAQANQADELENAALHFDPQGKPSPQAYVKRHPFSPGGENRHMPPGQQWVIWSIGGLQVAPLICYDLRFPETFRHLTCRGAQAFVVLANWPTARSHAWRVLLQARAIENQAWVLGVNRVGSDPQLSYGGESLLVTPRGEILEKLGDQEGFLSGVMNRDPLEAYRREFPVLEDLRREELGL